MQDLFTALGMLSSSVRSLATTRAIKSANEAVQKTLSSELDEAKKFSQMRQISTDLAMRLTATGANPMAIEQATQAIAPRENIQSIQGALFSQDPAIRQRAEGYMQQTQEASNREAQTSGLRDRIDKGQSQLLSSAKKQLEAYDAAQTLIRLVDAGQPLSDAALATFAARATGEVGNLTDAERAAFRGNQALFSRLRRAIKIGATGQLPRADRALIRDLAGTMAQGASQGVQQRASTISSQIAANYGVDPEQVMSRIMPQQLGAQKVDPVNQPGAIGAVGPGSSLNVRKYFK